MRVLVCREYGEMCPRSSICYATPTALLQRCHATASMLTRHVVRALLRHCDGVSTALLRHVVRALLRHCNGVVHLLRRRLTCLRLNVTEKRPLGPIPVGASSAFFSFFIQMQPHYVSKLSTNEKTLSLSKWFISIMLILCPMVIKLTSL